MDLNLREEKSSQERTKVIPLRILTKRKMKVMPEVKVHQSEEPREESEQTTCFAFMRLDEQNSHYDRSF